MAAVVWVTDASELSERIEFQIRASRKPVGFVHG
jgi:hypothetical protein